MIVYVHALGIILVVYIHISALGKIVIVYVRALEITLVVYIHMRALGNIVVVYVRVLVSAHASLCAYIYINIYIYI